MLVHPRAPAIHPPGLSPDHSVLTLYSAAWFLALLDLDTQSLPPLPPLLGRSGALLFSTLDSDSARVFVSTSNLGTRLVSTRDSDRHLGLFPYCLVDTVSLFLVTPPTWTQAPRVLPQATEALGFFSLWTWILPFCSLFPWILGLFPILAPAPGFHLFWLWHSNALHLGPDFGLGQSPPSPPFYCRHLFLSSDLAAMVFLSTLAVGIFVCPLRSLDYPMHT